MAWGSTFNGFSLGTDDAAASAVGGTVDCGDDAEEEVVFTRVLRMRRRPDPLVVEESVRRDAAVGVRLWRCGCKCRVRMVVA